MAVAKSVTVLDTTAPLAGDAIATLGGVVSRMVTLISGAIVRLPATSRAMAVSVCVPLAAVAVFHEIE